MLNRAASGAITKFSERPCQILLGCKRHARWKSVVYSGEIPTCPGGASGIVGITAPREVSCPCVNRPAVTNACPAGVKPPAVVELKLLITLLISPTLMLRPNAPKLVPGRGSPGLALVFPPNESSPMMSFVKMLPDGNVRFAGSAVAQWVKV